MNTAFYTSTRPECPLANLETNYNKGLLEHWTAFINERRKEGLAPGAIVREIKHRVSKSASKVKPMVKALIEFQRLPKSYSLALEIGHLDAERIIAIGNRLQGISDKVLAEIDERFADYLTPKVANEALVLARSVADHLDKLILEVDEEARERPKASESKGRVHVDRHQRFRFSFTLPTVDGAAVYANLQAFCTAHGCDLVEAFRRLVAGEKRPKAVLNIYASKEGLAFLPGAGWLSDADARRLRLTKRRILTTTASTAVSV